MSGWAGGQLSGRAHYGIVLIMEVKFIASGGVTSPRGFCAGAACAGIKEKDKLDLAILSSEVVEGSRNNAPKSVECK